MFKDNRLRTGNGLKHRYISKTKVEKKNSALQAVMNPTVLLKWAACTGWRVNAGPQPQIFRWTKLSEWKTSEENVKYDPWSALKHVLQWSAVAVHRGHFTGKRKQHLISCSDPPRPTWWYSLRFTGHFHSRNQEPFPELFGMFPSEEPGWILIFGF